MCLFLFFFNDTATTEIYTLSLHDALPISIQGQVNGDVSGLEFTLISLSTDSITMIELLSDNKFTILNLLPSYYKLNVQTTTNITLLDSIPVKQDSLTVLKKLFIPDIPYPFESIPPISNITKPTGISMVIQIKWILKPISYLFNKN